MRKDKQKTSRKHTQDCGQEKLCSDMASGEVGLRNSAVDDVGVSIERWQADAVARIDHGAGTGPIGSLFNSLIELLGLILMDMKTRPNMSQHYRSLESSSAALFFWGTDLGVSRGELDEGLQDSAQLRETCLMVLVSIGHFIISSFIRILHSKDRQKEILGSTGIALSLEQAMNILDQQHYPAYQPEQNEEALCQTLRLKIDTLVMLGPSLASPAEESVDDEEPRAIEDVEEHLPEQAYINSVAQRLPLAASTIVTHLGKLNWERYNHTLRLQRDAIQQEREMRIVDKARTIFHDSALGSSVPTQSEAGLHITMDPSLPQSVYAPSMVSSRAEASHRRLPPLPPQARSGEPFTCAICNKQVKYQRTKAWKKHIFEDILAYACPFADCSVADVFFEDRDAMMSHLERRHSLDVSISKVTCPLCLTYTSSDRDAFSLHFARHMEEIALAVLPSSVDSDDESENGGTSEAETVDLTHSSWEGKLVTEAATEHDIDTFLPVPSGSTGEVDVDSRAMAKAAQPAAGTTDNNADSTNELNDETAEQEFVTRCICGYPEYQSVSTSVDIAFPEVGDFFIQCDICDIWQHGGCVGVVDKATDYFCTECRPDLHEVTKSTTGRKYSRYLVVDNSPSRMHKADGPSSYWTVADQQDFEIYLAIYGTNWTAMANLMGTKTETMVKNRYIRLVEGGRTDLEEIAKNRDIKNEIHRLRQVNEEKDARLRQLEQAVMALQARYQKPDKQGLEEVARDTEIQKEKSSRSRDPSPASKRHGESVQEELQRLSQKNKEKDERLRELEQRVMALQQRHHRLISEQNSPQLQAESYSQSGEDVLAHTTADQEPFDWDSLERVIDRTEEEERTREEDAKRYVDMLNCKAIGPTLPGGGW